MKNILVSLLILLSFISCKSKENNYCIYTFDELAYSDSGKFTISFPTDTTIEIRDKGKEHFPSGLYIFDSHNKLRFYGFFIDEDHYRYSESYNSAGKLLKTEGTLLVEYRVWKYGADSILFNTHLFSLHRKFKKILIVSNNKDTIEPKHLFKSNIYSNMKCFSFKLSKKSIDSLILYAYIQSKQTCNSKIEYFNDTTFIGNQLKVLLAKDKPKK